MKTQEKKSTTTAEFSAQYKHPQWQKKRLEILERDAFTCLRCQSKDDTLHVHHLRYRKDHKLWEYEHENFLTLCDECHKVVHIASDTHLDAMAMCMFKTFKKNTVSVELMNSALMMPQLISSGKQGVVCKSVGSLVMGIINGADNE